MSQHLFQEWGLAVGGGVQGIPWCSCNLLTGVAQPGVKGQESFHGNTGLELLLVTFKLDRTSKEQRSCSNSYSILYYIDV